jgi:hypothetical protein
MNRICRAAVIFGMGLMVCLGPVRIARADITDVRGAWMGFSQSNMLPAVQDSFFDVVSQDNRRFKGRFMLFGQMVECDGSVSNANVVDITGRLGDIHFEVHGKLQVLRPPNPNTPGEPCRIAALKYRVEGPDHNVMDEGNAIVLKMQGGPNWFNPQPDPPGVPDVSGHWMGDYNSSVGPGGGSIEMDLRQLRFGGGIDQLGHLTTAFGGTLHMDGVKVPAVQSFFDLVFDTHGTVGVPAVQTDGSMASQFALIGLTQPPDPDRPGIIAILIGLLTPPDPNIGEYTPCLDLGYSLYGSFFDVFTEVWTGKLHSFDMGTAHLMFEPNNG